MKKIKILTALITLLIGCGPSKYEVYETENSYDNNKYTSIDSKGGEIRIKSVKHNNKDYVVATYREGICIIPEIK